MKKLSHKTEKAIRDMLKAESGPELVLQRTGGTFTFDVDVKSESEAAQSMRMKSQRVRMKG